MRGEEAENALAQRTDEQEREDAAELVCKKLRPGMDLSDRAEKDRVTPSPCWGARAPRVLLFGVDVGDS